MSAAAARRVFWTLTVTRWFPTGLIVGLITLWPLERGLSLSAALTAASLSGWVIVALELPTSGFADAGGRRPVYLVAALAGVAAALAYLVAESFWAFALAAVLNGVFRALDSGPLEAWFVDAVHADRGADDDVARPLATQSMLLGLSIAAGALTSAGLTALDPVPGRSALWLPFALYAALSAVHVVAVAVLIREERRPSGRLLDSVREAPGVVRDGLALLRSNAVLRGIVLVEVFWSLAMIVFESFMPVRFGELLGGPDRAGPWVGAATAAGWAVFALGAALAGALTPRLGVARTAMLARLLNGAGAVAMGLVAGPAALVAAYLFTYGWHGAGGPVHSALLHREASAGNRTTVLSINSMCAFAAYSAAAPGLAVLAGATSTQVAMCSAGAVSLLGLIGYRPARRREVAVPTSSGRVVR